ncbi:MAG TPA: tRNA (N6-threonylcarbamoyladenosine(37)-N6)-methyltransferase TrmO [Solirubrobacterales bacterium]|nr:tRNA (N6-threonylcarbamoyladenosine(37)-N6)-methyltransferase TrmO [Solirubrobacterales bacterium]
MRYELRAIGRVSSPLTEMEAAPMQGDEGAPDAWIDFEPDVLEALEGVNEGDRVVILTWLDRADREVLAVHPRDDPSRPVQGVFATRSQHRPNPIGLHRVEVVSIEDGRMKVRNLEALDGTTVVDVKPVLSGEISER